MQETVPKGHNKATQERLPREANDPASSSTTGISVDQGVNLGFDQIDSDLVFSATGNNQISVLA